ncbi:hypothetical protein [Microbispora sitophila]|uniref:hypothetical protein n=1 Tax=Microbispora sitophila TaxID=2771537 RepID=UPI001D00DAD9|nr:hypothetical protein [Microbispora sitophila]
MKRRGARVKAVIVGGLAVGLTCGTVAGAAHADVNRRPPRITSIIPDDGALRVTWGPDTFFSGTVPGESTVLYFGANQEGRWDDRGATTSFTVPAAHVRAYAGQAPRVTVCYLWPGHPSECSSSDPIPINGNAPSYPPGAGQLRPVPKPQALRVVAYRDYRATVQWVNGSPPYKKVLFRYDPGVQMELPGNATTATTGTLVPGRTYTFKVEGGWSGGLFSTRYSGWTEITYTVPKNPPFWPGGSVNKPYGPDTCKQGYVWRETTPADHVCVTPATRDQVRTDNALAASRRQGWGPYGADTCKQGYVWREATPADHVCVTPATRDQTRADNALAASRRLP